MRGNLRTLLEKGGAYAEAGKFDATLLADSRLFADMFPLVRQVQIATDGAKGCAARLAGTEAPKFEDTEKTLPEILARIDKTVAFLNSRSEEHTSELQSLMRISYAVFCLKKKTILQDY